MSTQFVVIKYVPDPVANESVNIGLLAVSEGVSRVHFVSDWRRARAIGGQQARYLLEFAREFEAGQEQVFGAGTSWSYESLKRYCSKWQNAVQLDAPRTSLRTLDSLFPELLRLYLKESPKRAVAPSRRTAASSVFVACSDAVEARFGTSASKELVKRSYELQGKLDSHAYDVAIANGVPYGAALGLSFASGSAPTIRREVDALAFAIEDVRQVEKKLELAVVYVPDAHASEQKRARRIFQSFNTAFVSHEESAIWAAQAVKAVPANALKQHQH
jgi:hypothetical protein